MSSGSEDENESNVSSAWRKHQNLPQIQKIIQLVDSLSKIGYETLVLNEILRLNANDFMCSLCSKQFIYSDILKHISSNGHQERIENIGDFGFSNLSLPEDFFKIYVHNQMV